MASKHVLRVNAAEEATAFLDAVHEVIGTILRENEGATLIDIAESIDCESKTIGNAFNKRHALSQAFLYRLGKRYGVHVLDPIAKLSGGRMVPLDSGNVADILPLILRAGTKIAEARDKDSPGGEREIHTEQLGYLPNLKRLQAEVTKLILEIEELAA